MMRTTTNRLALFCGLLLLPLSVFAFQPFVIEDIRVEGVQRLSAGTVFSYLPLKGGERIDELRAAQVIRALFKTGFFNDVRLEREDNVLVVVVRERPSIASIDIEGNRDIETDQLMESLKGIGMEVGLVYNRSVLEKVQQEMQRQYFANGKYGVRITTTVDELPRNRVAIKLKVEEGEAARIREINIVGNEVFDDETLRNQFTLTTPGLFTFISGSDQYSKQKLAGDLEALRAWYLDRGYLRFRIESTQVNISPDKKSIYITVNVDEGEQYTVRDFELTGKSVVPLEELEKLVVIQPGDVYSRKAVTASTSLITKRLGNEGFAFANVNAVPEVDDEKREVSLTFFVDPGRRAYVRRIEISGNRVTQDEVIRRELRQMEGSWLSTERVDRSRTRLNRLGFFADVNVETPAVPGTSDQVDVHYTVEERPSGNFLGSVGYSQTDGLLFSINLQESNFLGTGKRVGVQVNTSSVSTVYKIDYNNPYYTIDGISRGFALIYQQTDAEAANISNYNLDIMEGRFNWGIPISEYNRIFTNLGLRQTKIYAGCYASEEVTAFMLEYGGIQECIPIEETDDEGNTTVIGYDENITPAAINSIEAGFGWSRDTRNRAIFANRGAQHKVSLDFALPGGDMEYYKLRYRYKQYFPLFGDWVWMVRADLGYGDGYSTTDALPFYKNFYAGGPKTVRGYRQNTLGPRDSNSDPIGGSLLTTGGWELIVPLPFESSGKTFQMSLFFDVGNVFRDVDAFDAQELRASVGVSGTWMSPIGPIEMSLAQPVNDQPDDDIEGFQFTLGSTF